jgi:hypothetical protein
VWDQRSRHRAERRRTGEGAARGEGAEVDGQR